MPGNDPYTLPPVCCLVCRQLMPVYAPLDRDEVMRYCYACNEDPWESVVITVG